MRCNCISCALNPFHYVELNKDTLRTVNPVVVTERTRSNYLSTDRTNLSFWRAFYAYLITTGRTPFYNCVFSVIFVEHEAWIIFFILGICSFHWDLLLVTWSIKNFLISLNTLSSSNSFWSSIFGKCKLDS